MSRQTNFHSLSKGAINYLDKHARTEKIMSSSRHCPHCNKEIVDYIDRLIKVSYGHSGMFDECILYCYIDKDDGKKIFEYIQESPWSSGPYEFIALRHEDGSVIEESMWEEDEISFILGE